MDDTFDGLPPEEAVRRDLAEGRAALAVPLAEIAGAIEPLVASGVSSVEGVGLLGWVRELESLTADPGEGKPCDPQWRQRLQAAILPRLPRVRGLAAGLAAQSGGAAIGATTLAAIDRIAALANGLGDHANRGRPGAHTQAVQRTPAVLLGGDFVAENGGTVLVVESDPQVRGVLEESLRRFGFGVVTAASGDEVMRTVPRMVVDTILIDLHRGGEDGLDLVEKLKCHSECSHVPVLLLSSPGDERLVHRCLKAGADEVLLKPVGNTMLKDALRACQARKRRMDALRADNERLGKTLVLARGLLAMSAPAVWVDGLLDRGQAHPAPALRVGERAVLALLFQGSCADLESAVAHARRLRELVGPMNAKVEAVGGRLLAMAGEEFLIGMAGSEAPGLAIERASDLARTLLGDAAEAGCPGGRGGLDWGVCAWGFLGLGLPGRHVLGPAVTGARKAVAAAAPGAVLMGEEALQRRGRIIRTREPSHDRW